jgi:uncharacterized membrane protein (DUF106 family)
MGKFTLYNQQINLSKGLLAYNDIRIGFKSLAGELSNNFSEQYYKEIHNLDELSKFGYGFGSNFIAKAIDEAVEILIKHGIYDIDNQTFINKYYINYHTWDNDFNEINDKYVELVLSDKELDEYRVARRQSRGRVIGGGFGISGAAKGMVQAGAINMAAGAAHMIFNGVGKLVTSAAIGIQKNSIFKDPNTKRSLENGIYTAVFNVHYALVDVLLENKVVNISGISENSISKCHSILANLNTKQFESEVIKKLIVDGLLLNPYNEEVYKMAIEKIGDPDLELEKFGRIFNVDVKKAKNDYLNQKIKKLPKSSIEDYKQAINSLDEEEIHVGFDQSNEVRKNLLNELELFKLRQLREMRDRLSTSSEENVKLAIKKLKEEAKRIECDASGLLIPLNETLRKFEKQALTVEEFKYTTREEANKARDELSRIQELLSKNEITSKDNAIDAYNTLKSFNLKTKTGLKYLNIFSEKVKALEEVSASTENKNIKPKEVIDQLNYIKKVINSSENDSKIARTGSAQLDESYGEKIKKANEHLKRKQRNIFLSLFLNILAIIVVIVLIKVSLLIHFLYLGYILTGFIVLVYIANIYVKVDDKRAWKEVTINGSREIPYQ